MGGENGRNVYSSLSAERQCYAGKPFVELCNNSAFLLMVDILDFVSYD